MMMMKKTSVLFPLLRIPNRLRKKTLPPLPPPLHPKSVRSMTCCNAALSADAYYLSDLPSAAMYEKSYTHPSHVLLSCVTPHTNFLYTASLNGSVKIWKKFPIVSPVSPFSLGHRVREAVLRAPGPRRVPRGLGGRPFRGLCGRRQARGHLRHRRLRRHPDLLARFPPRTALLGARQLAERVPAGMGVDSSPRLAISDAESHAIGVYSIENPTPLFTFRYHKQPIVGLLFHPTLNFIVSLDQGGVFAYWVPQDGALPKNSIEFRFMIATDLYIFRKNKVVPMTLSASLSGNRMAVFALDWKVRFALRDTSDVHFRRDDRQAPADHRRVGRGVRIPFRAERASHRRFPLRKTPKTRSHPPRKSPDFWNS